MKLLREFDSTFEATELSEKLENKGILTHVSSTHSHSLSRSATGEVKCGLWIVLNNQYNDAKKIIDGESEHVTNPLTQQQIIELKRQTKLMAPNLVIRHLTKVIAGLFACFLLALIINKLFIGGE